MIYDSFSNKSNYFKTHPLFEKAFEYLDEFIKAPMAPGRYEICGDDLFVVVQSYETKDEGLLEAHDKYIDIQCMISGTEKVSYANREGLETAVAYDADKDLLVLKNTDSCTDFVLRAGEFMIFYPADAHRPAITASEKSKVIKLVFKVKM